MGLRGTVLQAEATPCSTSTSSCVQVATYPHRLTKDFSSMGTSRG